MLAVVAAVDQVTPHLLDDVVVAAINGPAQTVISGSDAGVGLVAQRLSAAGLPWRRLSTSGAFHSPLMSGVVVPLTVAASGMRHAPPDVPWMSSVNGAALRVVPTDYWGRQVVEPVRWHAALTAARDAVSGRPVWLEVGPGHTLTQLARGQAGEMAVASLEGADADAAIARALGTLWTAGCAPDWTAYHGGARRHRVALPTYPFQRQRYWLEAGRPAPPTVSSGTKRQDVGSWLYQPCWKQVPAPPAGRRAAPGRCLLLTDDDPLCRDLVRDLEGRGWNVIRASAGVRWSEVGPGQFSIDANDPNHFSRLIERLHRDGRHLEHVVLAWGLSLGRASNRSDGQLDADFGSGFYSLLYLAQALVSQRRHSTPVVRLTVLSCGAVSVQGDERIEPARAAVLGLARVIGQEHPFLSVRVIDVEPAVGTGDVALVADDLLSDSSDSVVAWRHRRRSVPTCEALPTAGEPLAASEAMPVTVGAAYLITGGLGRVGLALAQELAQHGPVRLVLVSRTPFPPREAWEAWRQAHGTGDRVSERISAIRDIEATGSSVTIVPADVADRAQMRTALAEAEAHAGVIRGVIHAAGATTAVDFAAITELDRAACERQFRPKVQGACVLREVFAGRRLDFLLLTSSLASTLGGLRFGAYAAANAVLDALATAESATAEQRWVSVQWDGWQFDESRDTSPADRGRAAMTAAEGRQVCRRVLSGPALPVVVVSTAELAPRMTRAEARLETGGRSTAPASAHPRPPLSTPFVGPRTEIEGAIGRAWQQALGLGPIGVHDNFFELGGDSLVAVHLMSALSSEFSLALSPRHLWDAPTLEALAARVEALRGGVEGSAQAHLSRALDAVQRLSDDELERLLSNDVS